MEPVVAQVNKAVNAPPIGAPRYLPTAFSAEFPAICSQAPPLSSPERIVFGPIIAALREADLFARGHIRQNGPTPWLKAPETAEIVEGFTARYGIPYGVMKVW